jgi:integrase/recombinase XerD
MFVLCSLQRENICRTIVPGAVSLWKVIVMAAFTLTQSEQDPSIFFVVGPDGTPASDINAFLVHLASRGRSAYTLRSYAQGLAHFLDWLHARGDQVDEVTPQVVEAYITDFSFQTKGGACSIDPAKIGQINLLTRKSAPTIQRQPRTINHRLSVLASFFTYRIRQDSAQDGGPWLGRPNPVPAGPNDSLNAHGMPGRDVPRRGQAGELRQRIPRHLPRQVDPVLASRLIDSARSWRDKAILTLLYRTGQRIGDWSEFAGRHGILGMTVADVDERTGTITVRLKGARDEHRVPVTDDFWPLYQQYLRDERNAAPSLSALWISLRKGKGMPLSYASFESSLRYIGRKLGANVNAHMFRHTLAQTLVDQGQLKVAQDLLGHRHLSTTADIYATTDQQAMVQAVFAAKSLFETERMQVLQRRDPGQGASSPDSYVFLYDEMTLQELDQAALHSPEARESQR